MPSYVLNPSTSGNAQRVYAASDIVGATELVLRLSNVAKVAGFLSGTGVATEKSLTADMRKLTLKTNVANAFSLSGVRFKRGGVEHVVKASGEVQVSPSPITGNGTTVGTMTPAQGEVTLNAWAAGSPTQVTEWRGVAAAPVNGADTPYGTYLVTFRTAVSPIKVGSLSVLGTMRDGTTFNVVADQNGVINTPRIKGRVNYTTGVVSVVGVTPTGAGGQTAADLSFLEIPGVSTGFIDMIRQETMRYNAVSYSYLPLDATLLGIDPVRLPSDGRVPIFRAGGLAVVGHTATTTARNVVGGSVIDADRVRLSRVELLDRDGTVIQGGYTENLEAGTVTVVDPSSYAQPVRLRHRIEDTALMRDVQIDGTITFTRALSHVYPAGSYVSSCLRSPDLKARVSSIFDQEAWDGTTFAAVVVGNPASATYNAAGYPIRLTNAGAITQRWALRFKTSTTFDLIGEAVGYVASGSTLADFEPLNPITQQPYMRIPLGGFGAGWVLGNLLRVDTVGAMFPVWQVRTVQQGPESASDYSYLTLVRGDIDNPAI